MSRIKKIRIILRFNLKLLSQRIGMNLKQSLIIFKKWSVIFSFTFNGSILINPTFFVKLPLTLPMPESMKQLHKHIQELINSGRQPTLSGATYLAKTYKEHLDSYCDRELKCIIKTHENISQKISNRLCNTPSKSSKTLRNRGKPLTIKNQSIDKASVRVK